jgi:hypothetical protein
MTFHLPSLLYKSALIQQEIEAEHSRPRPSRLRLMRLKTLRLKVMERLHALARSGSGPALGSAGA